MYLLIHATPPVCLYRATAAAPAAVAALCLPRLTSCGALRRPLAGAVGSGETPNATLTLDNGDGALSALWPLPPVRCAVTLVTDSGATFSGIITGITLAENATLEIQAGTSLPLSDLLPLRHATLWGSYRADDTLPLLYGTCTMGVVPADDAGLKFLIADHPCEAVEKVWRDNVIEPLYTWQNAPDSTGHACCFIRVNTPLKVNQRLTVRARGKMHPTTGALLTNPADVAWDLLANICGVTTAEADLDQFRAACFAAGYTVSGVLDDGRATIRSSIDAIMQSCGAVWSGGMPGLAKLYP